jgi:hypothetical protein
MSGIASLVRRLRVLACGADFVRDLDDEMRLHMELRRERLAAQGAGAAEARAGAVRQFGNALRLREESRDSWGWRWLEHLAQDLRFGTRMAVRNPGYSLAAVLTLALGIGANTAVFSVLYGVALKPLPYTNGERLLLIRQSAPGIGVADAQVSVAEFDDYRARTTAFDALVEPGARDRTARRLLLQPRRRRARLHDPGDARPYLSAARVLGAAFS